jgi:predicted GNAT family N-acyltransferase
MDFLPEELLSDKDDFHFVAQIGDQIIGGLIVSLVLGASPPQARIRQVAVAQEFQGQGVGEKLMAVAEDFCRSLKIQKVFLHARYGVRGFYTKLGYFQDGEIFEAVGIPHIAMLKEFREN